MDNVIYMADCTRIMDNREYDQSPEDVPDVTAALKDLRERAGYTMAKMAKLLGYKGASSYQRYEDPALYTKPYLPLSLIMKLRAHLIGRGTPKITHEEIVALCHPDYRGKETPLGAGTGRGGPLRILGEVQAGVWKEVPIGAETHSDIGLLPIRPIEANGQEYALLVRGTSMNKIAKDGDYIICRDVLASGVEPQIGDLVVVERIRDDGSIYESTVKRLCQHLDIADDTRRMVRIPYLAPESTDERFQEPIALSHPESGDAEVRIRAIVLMVVSIENAAVYNSGYGASFGSRR